MHFTVLRSWRVRAAAFALVGAVLLAHGVSAKQPFATFDMVPGAGIASCLPNAHGHVSIVSQGVVELMHVDVRGLPANAEFDLFVTELPKKPIGVAWYQSDLKTDSHGNGHVDVVGRFNEETFAVSTGGPTTTFPPTHMYHLGLWFNDPQLPFILGCEPNQAQATVTVFNGEQHAGIQVLNTSNFPDNAGPLSQVK